jgi:putative addiction module killer protein
MAEVREDLDRNGRSPYAEWFDGLNAQAAAKVAIAVTRIGQGNFSNVRSVGSGVHECKINFDPGYRVYFGEKRREPCLNSAAERKSGSKGTSTTLSRRGRTARSERNKENQQWL